MAIDVAAALAEIAAETEVCTRCPLYKGTLNDVPGAGSPKAEILFIGEGPGANEDKQGLPFVGASGKYLEKLLASIGLTREDVFITNVVKHRPPENRDPMPDEIAACRPYLERQIELIDPLLICTLGRHSMARYFPNGKITKIHGVPEFDVTTMRAYYPLFHPAAVLRNPGWQEDMAKDFKRIPAILERVRARRAGDGPPEPKDAPPAVPPEPPREEATKPEPPPEDDGPMSQLPLF
jgi:DNA polymerase